MFLTLPNTKYEKSFFAMLAEFEQDNGPRMHAQEVEGRSFAEYVELLQKHSLGQELPKNFVPYTEYWLIDNEEIIGRLSIRHFFNEVLEKVGGNVGYAIRPSQRRKGYGKKILELALPKARELGMNKLLLTCNYDNIGSQKIIAANGGVFENRVQNGDDKDKLRYWITL